MKSPLPKPPQVVRQLMVYAALLTIVVLALLHFHLFRPFDEALKLLLPNVLASVITVLLIYAFYHTLLKEADKLLTHDDVEYIATEIVDEILKRFPTKDLLFYERWMDIPWQDIIGEAMEMDILASYMDTWLIETADLLRRMFARGGSIRAILPEPGSEAASRVLERFPEYNLEIVFHKIRSTANRLQRLLEQSSNNHAQFKMYWTRTFCMHCLLRIDNKWLVISPFDHFRREQIEGPAFVINLHSYLVYLNGCKRNLMDSSALASLRTLIGRPNGLGVASTLYVKMEVARGDLLPSRYPQRLGERKVWATPADINMLARWATR